MLYTAHGFHFYKGAPKISRLYYSVEKAMIRYTDGIITINEEDYLAAKKMCRNKKCDAYKISGIGIDLSRVRNSTRTREDIRDEFGIPHDAFLVMSNSEINENKNVECSIAAVAANKGVYMLICGTGKSMDKCRDLVKELVAQTGSYSQATVMTQRSFCTVRMRLFSQATVRDSDLRLSRLWEQVFRLSFRITEERENMR